VTGHSWYALFRIIGLLAGSAMLGPFGIAVAVIIIICMALSDGKSSSAGAGAKPDNPEYEAVSTLNVTCPSCDNENVFHESGEVLCAFCGCGLVIDKFRSTVRCQTIKIKCVKCSDLLKYDYVDTRCYCHKCDIMYIRKGRSLVANCYACGGSGETGAFKKATCSRCHGGKKLAVSID
jgi:hypothetical protein